jgi:predicted ATPase/DNA-binding XRE family transcriptional regulator
VVRCHQRSSGDGSANGFGRAAIFGALRRHRVAAGLTQEALAERAGLSVTGIQKLERGPGHPYRDTVERLIAALPLSPEAQVELRAAGRSLPHQRGEDASEHLTSVADLPEALTSFVGREREIAELSGLLASVRLLTLTGVGGCGKTRLAVKVASVVADTYVDGVRFVDLAPLVDPALVPQAVATAVGVRETPMQPLLARLVSVLKARQLLLVLDNCEHLIDACAQLADTLLRACPGVRILATSRAALVIDGEVTRRVPSLSLPPRDVPAPVGRLNEFGAVRLFVERANAVQPDFVVTEHNAAAVARVCHRLDGIPLALELAAARTRTLGVNQILDRLDSSVALLVGGSRTAPTRQQTMRATLDWSYGLLASAEQALFRRLAPFAGSFPLEAVESVCAGDDVNSEAVLNLIAGLVDKSLVLAETGAGETRYRLHEIVRQYALEHLNEVEGATALRARHRDWYLELAERALPKLTGADQRIWYERLTAEYDNLRAALEWTHADPDGAGPELRLAAALGRYWDIYGPRRDGRMWVERALSRGPSAATSARASALLWAGTFALFEGEAARSHAMLTESVAVARQIGDSRMLTNALRHLGSALHAIGDASGRVLLQEALTRSRAASDSREVAYALCYLGRIVEEDGDPVGAERLYSEGLAAARRSGDALPASQLLLNLGRVAAARGDYARAAALMEESLALSELRHWGAGERGMALLHLASLARSMGDTAMARTRCVHSLYLAANHGESLMLSRGLRMMGGLEWAAGRFSRAACLFGAETAGRPHLALVVDLPHPSPTSAARYAEDLAATRHALGDNAFEVAWAQGEAMTLEEAARMILTDEIVPVRTAVGIRAHDSERENGLDPSASPMG